MSLLERFMLIDVKFRSVVRLATTIVDYHTLTCLSHAIRLMFTLGWYHPSQTFFIFCIFSVKNKPTHVPSLMVNISRDFR